MISSSQSRLVGDLESESHPHIRRQVKSGYDRGNLLNIRHGAFADSDRSSRLATRVLDGSVTDVYKPALAESDVVLLGISAS
jgi:hypothetical protein